MNATWIRWATRIDAMSARERVILFVSIALALVALTDALVLSPRAAEQKLLTAKLRSQAAELDALRQRMGATDTSSQTPTAKLLRELQATQAERAAVDAEIQRNSATGHGVGLTTLFERVLRRHERLVLVKFATGTATPARPGEPPAQSVEIGLHGRYLDLAAYVDDLERSLPGLRWDELAVLRREGSAELRARLVLPGETP